MRIVEPIRSALIAALLASLGALAQGYAHQQAPPGPQKMPAPQSKEDQAPPAPTQATPPRPESAISVESAIVNLDVLVVDEDGRVLGGLKKENFRILDGGRPQVVTNFAAVSEPITVVMLLEYSGIAYDYFAYKNASWGSIFLDYLNPEDWVALVTYDMRPTIAVDFTHRKPDVLDALQRLSYPQFREANLYDAMFDTLDRLERIKGKKSILLIATGANTFSAHNLDQMYQRLKESDVTVFSVGVAEREYMQSGGSLSYYQAKNELATFAKLTGGHSWFPRFDGELPSIFESVATFLRNQYRIGFSPPDLPHNGKYHKLKVEIVGSDGKPLIVTNEKKKRRKVTVFAREGYVDPKQPAKK
jgi:VWFA-related protein